MKLMFKVPVKLGDKKSGFHHYEKGEHRIHFSHEKHWYILALIANGQAVSVDDKHEKKSSSEKAPVKHSEDAPKEEKPKKEKKAKKKKGE